MIGVGCGSPRGGGGGAIPSLSIEVYSDAGYTIPVASLAYGSTAYVKLVASDIIPTTHTLFFGNGTKNAPQVTQAGNTFAWVVSLAGTVTISATATEGATATADATPFTLTSTIVITNSLKFDGVNDMTNCFSLPMLGENFSVSMWVKMNNTTVPTPFFQLKDINSSKPSLIVGYVPSLLGINAQSWNQEWTLNNFGTISADGDWHNVIVTYDYTLKTLVIYWDGVVILNAATYYINFETGLINLAIASDWGYIGSRYGDINTADISVHNTVLTQTQATAMQVLGTASGDEVQRYPITETVGTTSGYISDPIGGIPMQLFNMIAPYGVVADKP